MVVRFHVPRKILAVFALGLLTALQGCAYLPLASGYKGPKPRPPELDQYYTKAGSYTAFSETVEQSNKRYTLKKIKIESSAGVIGLTYYQRHEVSDSLVLVFPVLGGKKNLIENYFADDFARRGFDAAIVERNDNFKNPQGFLNLEEVLREMVVRDRIAMDFFEREYKKTQFGSFGISRGAINVAMTAGVDPRLKYNVLALGGSDIVGVFRDSDERRIATYKEAVMKQESMTIDEFYASLEERIKTDPKLLANYMDARNTLLFLAVFDHSVPFKYGQMLRDQMGGPAAIYLLAGHRTSLLYTALPNHVPPLKSFPIMPFDYIETESLAFFRKSFYGGGPSMKEAVLNVVTLPFRLIASLVDRLTK